MDSLLLSPVPQISISPAPPAEPLVEPFSPFASEHTVPVQEDGYRPSLLSPPPVASPSRFHRQPSPLRFSDSPVGKGLERDRFEALLANSKERNASTGKRAPDLRKEIALKTHKSKQLERRALFLSKVTAPPSPSATATPKTPPESPAIFHYSLPSPGLESPLALYEAMGQDSFEGKGYHAIQPWVEQVDFRRSRDESVKARPCSTHNAHKGKPLPSLDQISAHLSTHGHPIIIRDEKHRRTPIPLPAFLRSSSPPQEALPAVPEPAPVTKSRVPLILVNRTRKASGLTHEPVPVVLAPKPQLVPASPQSPVETKLHITTTVVPRSSNTSPTQLTEINLVALNSRESSGRDMMSKLRRRMSGVESAHGRPVFVSEDEERKARRVSAPAELFKRERHGFAHPVLALPGGF
ncbi:hypothetical protein BV25DRAFT_1819199 [Artomyces pyxidatus]|uniref:Uncharacterized protein n=1 Tax=Artomyces pyxidatus TaxID=48021 RepID=A0ACB8THA9_9AGAM|nr:hypothetical protein BV25DRAFT_1819199 [Artomyces pyxidatus]